MTARRNPQTLTRVTTPSGMDGEGTAPIMSLPIHCPCRMLGIQVPPNILTVFHHARSQVGHDIFHCLICPPECTTGQNICYQLYLQVYLDGSVG